MTMYRLPPALRPPSVRSPLPLLAVTLLVSACNRAPEALPESQVAARVNKSEITVHQVHSVLQRNPRAVGGSPETAGRRVLDALVEQELAAQAARADGLDRDPDVVQVLEATRREVLARAYQDRQALRVTAPTSDEIDAFYAAQPLLFAKRRVYTLKEYQIESPPAAVDRVRALAASAKSSREFDDGLTAAGWPQRTRIYAQGAEELPLALLPSIAALTPGQSLVVEQPAGARVFVLLHAEPASVERRLATEAIRAYLLTERRRAEMQRAMRALRDAASIEYSRSFAAAAPAASAPR